MAAAEENSTEDVAPVKSKKMLIIGGAVVLLIAAGGGFYFWKSRSHTGPEVKKVTAFVDMPEITINLVQLPGQERQAFLRIKIALEVADAKTAAAVQPLMPRLMDTYQALLRELKPSDLEGSAGFYRLKEELTRRTNMAVQPERVDAVLFKEMLIQ